MKVLPVLPVLPVLQVRRVVDGQLNEFPPVYLGADAIAKIVKAQAAASAQGAAGGQGEGDKLTVQIEAYTYEDVLAAKAHPASSAQQQEKKNKNQVPACPVVLMDVETTGFGNDSEIVQLAAKCKGITFSVYVLPTGGIQPQASKVRYRYTVTR